MSICFLEYMYNEDSLWRKKKELDNQKRRQSTKETLEKSVKYVHEIRH